MREGRQDDQRHIRAGYRNREIRRYHLRSGYTVTENTDMANAATRLKRGQSLDRSIPKGDIPTRAGKLDHGSRSTGASAENCYDHRSLPLHALKPALQFF